MGSKALCSSGFEALPVARRQLCPRRLRLAAAHCYPFSPANERLQALLGGTVAAHPVAIDTQREAGALGVERAQWSRLFGGSTTLQLGAKRPAAAPGRFALGRRL